MNHDKLLEDARELADKIGHVDLSLIRCVTDSAMLRALADLVERQDKALAETVGACGACDEQITNVLAYMGHSFNEAKSAPWITLRAARDRAKLAAKLGEPKGDDEGKSKNDVERKLRVVCETCAEVFRSLIAYPSAKRNLAYWTMLDDAHNMVSHAAKLGDTTNEVKLMDGSLPTNAADSAKQEAVLRDVYSEPVRPVEVEMQCIGGGNNWTWQCCLVGVWIVSQCYADDECEPVNYPTKQAARSNGKRWLTALADQLGVPLVAVWKGGE